MTWKTLLLWLTIPLCGIALASIDLAPSALHGDGPPPGQDVGDDFLKRVQPLLQKYCFECHSKKVHKTDLDLERFVSLAAIRKDLTPWQHLIERVEVGEMPPKGKPQPSADERKLIVAWVRAMLDAEARARKGDPGRVPLRRLSNAEYDCTIRDLTGVDLRPTREFPADGAAGEGFKLAMRTLDVFRTSVAAAALGFARRALDEALQRATTRKMFNGVLADFQLTQAKLAQMATAIDSAALLTYRAAWQRDQGRNVTREAAMAKLTATENAQQVIDAALQMWGGLGVVSEQPVEKLYREIRALRIYEGATEVQQLIIARELLREASSHSHPL